MGQIQDQYIIGKKYSVEDEILLLNPLTTPLLSLLGMSEAVTNTKHEWIEDEMFAQESKTTAGYIDSDTDIAVADIEPFRVEQIIQINDELLKVTAINAGTNTLTVERGHAGTTASAIDSGDIVKAMFVEGIEGRDARDSRYKPRAWKENYTQIFDDSIRISGTAEAVLQHGIANEYEKEKQKKLQELALQLENALINGIPYNNGDRRLMGGVRHFVNTNIVDASGHAGDILDMLNDLAQNIYETGGFKTGGRYYIMVGAKQKREISKYASDSITLERRDDTRGQRVDNILTDFGAFPVIINNNLKSDELFLVDANRMAIKPLRTRNFMHEFLGKKGDYTEGMIVGEYTFEFTQEKAHGRIMKLS